MQPRFYFPELDGLRFIAFALVFIHHAPSLNNRVMGALHRFGWIGVDLFFALSAFLFVKILSKEFDKTGTITIGKFYIRRGLRIWPIYAIYCILMTGATYVADKPSLSPWRALGLARFVHDARRV
jgi:peptidoglycan/LPS O-acetylase OafA/YrhL